MPTKLGTAPGFVIIMWPCHSCFPRNICHQPSIVISLLGSTSLMVASAVESVVSQNAVHAPCMGVVEYSLVERPDYCFVMSN